MWERHPIDPEYQTRYLTYVEVEVEVDVTADTGDVRMNMT